MAQSFGLGHFFLYVNKKINFMNVVIVGAGVAGVNAATKLVDTNFYQFHVSNLYLHAILGIILNQNKV